MDKGMLLHSSELELNGEVFRIEVYGSAGRFSAKTWLGEGDAIITDGPSVSETLRKHEDLLPLAVSSREIVQIYFGHPRRSEIRRTT